ncbi:MAG: DHA2 family efflux MFS transporter permease subunit [Thermoleophilaceae bacterium]|nr:DHA2 family efflux MFS transporter permease subunit [Thermoleophilaceae bacterium]
MSVQDPQPPSLVRGNPWVALYVLCAGMLMIVLDATVVNVALPSIKDDLGFSQQSLAWVVNAYMITFGGLLLLSGRLGDLIGRKVMFLSGIAVFTVASLACGLAPSQGTLVAARLLQGVGGAMASAVILGMIFLMFSSPGDQARAIGVFGFVASAGGSIGLILGGVITDSISWHWIFTINVPIGIAVGIAAHRLLVRDPGLGMKEGTDAPGAVLITSALMLGVFTIVKPAADLGWSDPLTLLFGAGSLVLLALFIWRESVAKTPLIPLRIFRSRNVSGANIVQALLVAGMFGMFFLGALYFEQILNYTPLEIGFAYLPATIIMGTISLKYSEPLIIRFGPRRILIPAMALITAGLLWFARVPEDGRYLTDILPAMVLLGFGIGPSFPALMTLAMSASTAEDAGLASGMINTSAQVGGALGLAVLATLSATRTENALADGVAKATALADGFQLAFLIGAGILALACALSTFLIRDVPAPAHAHAEEETLGALALADSQG